MTPKRGRPAGWRKDVTRPYRVTVQFSEDERGWLLARAESIDGTENDVIRKLIENERRREVENHYHVTAIRNGGAYGHRTTGCDESGCAGSELYLAGVDPESVQLHHVYEIDDNGKVIAEIV